MNHAVSRSGFYRAQGHRYRQSLRVDGGTWIGFRRFDEAYYHRFYESPQTRVVSPKSTRTLASFVVGFARGIAST